MESDEDNRRILFEAQARIDKEQPYTYAIMKNSVLSNIFLVLSDVKYSIDDKNIKSLVRIDYLVKQALEDMEPWRKDSLMNLRQKFKEVKNEN
jgi:hypothetical protein